MQRPSLARGLAGAYQNATWAVAVAKGGFEEGQAMLADTFIVAPSGEIVAHSQTQGDELVVAECDLDRANSYQTTIFDFAAHRKPQPYSRITEFTCAVSPPLAVLPGGLQVGSTDAKSAPLSQCLH
jgi:hypothetical protein